MPLSRNHAARLRLAFLPALTLGLCIALAESYGFLARFIGGPSYRAAALLHSALALLLLCCCKKGSWQLWQHQPLKLFQQRPSLAYLPALGVAAATWLVLVGEQGLGSEPLRSLPRLLVLESWQLILWVPIVEELALRVGLGSLLKRVGGRLWGGYFSMLAFTLLHSQPSLERVLAGQLSLPWGPFLLALCCELLYGWSNRIMPAILLHMACNATAVVFSWGGGEHWFQILAFLYQPLRTL